jgi:hypothetical protein
LQLLFSKKSIRVQGVRSGALIVTDLGVDVERPFLADEAHSYCTPHHQFIHF